MECAPAFNYARSSHTLELLPDYSADPTIKAPQPHNRAYFSSLEAQTELDLRFVPDILGDFAPLPEVNLKPLDLRKQGHLGISVCSDILLEEGQAVW